MNSKLSYLCAAGVLLGITGGVTAPIHRADLPADPSWVVHVDCDRLRPTAIGQFIMAQLQKPEAEEKFAALQGFIGVDPRKQLHGLTLYGNAADPKMGVLIAYADFDAGRLVSVVQNAKDYEAADYNNHVIHSWFDEEEQRKKGGEPHVYAAIEGSRIFFSRMESALKAALDVLDHGPNMASTSNYSQLGAKENNDFVQAAVHKIDLGEAGPHAEVLKLSKQLSLGLADAEHEVRAKVNLDARKAENAPLIAEIAKGLLALGKLQKDNPKFAQLQPVFDAITISQDQAAVTIQLAIPDSKVVEVLKGHFH